MSNPNYSSNKTRIERKRMRKRNEIGKLQLRKKSKKLKQPRSDNLKKFSTR